MKLLINFEISKSYAEWKAFFDEHKAARDAANIKDVFVGVEAATMQAFMQSPENAANIEKAGHIVESTVMVPLAD